MNSLGRSTQDLDACGYYEYGLMSIKQWHTIRRNLFANVNLFCVEVEKCVVQRISTILCDDQLYLNLW